VMTAKNILKETVSPPILVAKHMTTTRIPPVRGRRPSKGKPRTELLQFSICQRFNHRHGAAVGAALPCGGFSALPLVLH